jgi:hypothetical protein
MTFYVNLAEPIAESFEISTGRYIVSRAPTPPSLYFSFLIMVGSFVTLVV